MAATEVEICNLALAKIGSGATIASLTETTPEASACYRLYYQARNVLLESRPWSFAYRRALLAEIGDFDDTSADVWSYCYYLPNDCLKTIKIWEGTTQPYKNEVIPFTIEYDNTNATRVLLTNYETDELILEYIAKIEDPVLYPPSFVDALASALAARLASILVVRPELTAALEVRAELEAQRAWGWDQSQIKSEAGRMSDFERGRY